MLQAIPSIEEIKDTVFSMGPTKSPGHDGFNARFYQVSWSIIQADFCIIIQNFFLNNIMPVSANHTLLVLIAKKTSPQSAKDYRPISLCTIIYKMI